MATWQGIQLSAFVRVWKTCELRRDKLLFFERSKERREAFANPRNGVKPFRQIERLSEGTRRIPPFPKIVWDDRQCDEAPLIAALRIVGPQAIKIHLRFNRE